MQNVYEQRKNMDIAESAKLLRSELKAKFPIQKFSVRISRYSMGESIEVS